MKIGQPQDIQLDTPLRAGAGNRAAAGVAAERAAAPAAGVVGVPPSGAVTGDRVALSAAAVQLTGATWSAEVEFDQAKVQAIQAAIREGRFTIDAGAIADRLIADAAALLAPRTGT